MANNFAGIATFGFQGTTFRLPIALPQGTVTPPNQVPPSICPVTIDWNLYFQLAGGAEAETPVTAVGVSINLQAASVQASILDRIASVKIDNTGSPNSVYVQFPDTGDVVNCPPNCSVTFPCLTNLLQANVYILGLEPDVIPTTRIFFYNVVLAPAVDYELDQSIALWLASPSITRGDTILNENYGTPALGDQIVSVNANLGVIGTTQILPPQESGFYYITSICLTITGAAATDGAVSKALLQFADGNTLIDQTFFAMDTSLFDATNGIISLYQMSGLNLKFDATQALNYINNVALPASGFATASITLTFTYQAAQAK
jgi:hypothetical protein